MPGRRKDLRPKAGVEGSGPGAYNPSYNYTKEQGPMYSLSQSLKVTNKTAREGGNSLIYTITGPPENTHDLDKPVKNKAATWVVGKEARPDKWHHVP